MLFTICDANIMKEIPFKMRERETEGGGGDGKK